MITNKLLIHFCEYSPPPQFTLRSPVTQLSQFRPALPVFGWDCAGLPAAAQIRGTHSFHCFRTCQRNPRMATEKFCLRWNDFESNISVAFRELRDDKDFFDVTLACDDQQIQAHKVILSACSPFFRGVLRRNPHAHPLLYLKGVKFTDLQAVLNFMYHGEVNVAQEELNSFLSVAEELKVKGLTQNQTGGGGSSPSPSPGFKPRPPDPPAKRPRPPQPPVRQEVEEVQEVVMPSVKSEVVVHQEYEGEMVEEEDGGMEQYQEEYGEQYDHQLVGQGGYNHMEGQQADAGKGDYKLCFNNVHKGIIERNLNRS